MKDSSKCISNFMQAMFLVCMISEFLSVFWLEVPEINSGIFNFVSMYGSVCKYSTLGLYCLKLDCLTAVLGRLPGTTVYRNVQQYPEAYTYNGIVIVRIDAPIYFANISFIKDRWKLILLLSFCYTFEYVWQIER